MNYFHLHLRNGQLLDLVVLRQVLRDPLFVLNRVSGP